jgi:hypothetical protein
VSRDVLGITTDGRTGTDVPSIRTVLEPTGGNNVGIVVPEDVGLSFGRGSACQTS